jgi:archaeal type IV pilus assembly protein PilA
MNNFQRLIKNRKAISPIFATLILIAIAVIAGVVVYMFTSGTLATMTNGGTAAQEKVTVQAASYSSGTVTVYLQQTGGPAGTINGLIIKDGSGSTKAVATAITMTAPAPTPNPNPAPLTAGTLTTITGTVTLTSGTYTVDITTKAGGSFVSPSFVVP